MENKNTENKRRNFLRVLLSAGTTIGLTSMLGKKAKAMSTDKVKMLTPDGKLVEIDRSLIEKHTPANRASNHDVQNWMNNKADNL